MDAPIAVDEQNVAQVIFAIFQNATAGLVNILMKRMFLASGPVYTAQSRDEVSTVKCEPEFSVQPTQSKKRFSWKKRGL